MKLIEYKIEKNVPYVRSGPYPWDDTLPEYITMLKLKVGDSFEFPRERASKIQNCRVHLRKIGSPLCFTFTTINTFKLKPKLMTGRCWRIKDGSFKNMGSKKKRVKGAAINLTEHE